MKLMLLIDPHPQMASWDFIKTLNTSRNSQDFSGPPGLENYPEILKSLEITEDMGKSQEITGNYWKLRNQRKSQGISRSDQGGELLVVHCFVFLQLIYSEK